MNDITNTAPLPATISRVELFRKFLSSTFIEERSGLETDFGSRTVKERFLNRASYTRDLPQLDDPRQLLNKLADDQELEVRLDDWIDGLSDMLVALRFLQHHWAEVLHEHDVKAARHELIEALERSNDQIGIHQNAITDFARQVIKYEQDCKAALPVIKQAEHLSTVQKFLGEAQPVLDRTYGQAAELALKKLEPKAAS